MICMAALPIREDRSEARAHLSSFIDSIRPSNPLEAAATVFSGPVSLKK